MRFKILILVVALIFVAKGAYGQYYILGQDPASLKWEQIKSQDGNIIYPHHLDSTARVVIGYREILKPTITQGLNNRIDEFPVVIHSKQLQSNGMVSWAPARMELFSSPPTDSYALSWLRQLVPHEYRHVVQMSNLNVGFTSGLKYVIGQSAMGIVALISPTWFYEGDATLAETRYAMFGRGRQPSFSMPYRALLADSDPQDMSFTKMVHGSIKNYNPGAYELGYYMVSAGNYLHGSDFWRKGLDYAGRYPFLLFSPNIAYHKFYDTSVTELKDQTFSILKQKWAAASSVENSSQIIPTPISSYTEYTNPLPYKGLVVATKSDRDSPPQVVVVDSLGVEKRIARMGNLSSRAVLDGDRLYWTEYVTSAFWGLESFSNVRYLDLSEVGSRRLLKSKSLTHKRNIFFFTPMGGNQFAFVEYSDYNVPQIVIASGDSLQEQQRIAINSSGASLNGVAWDSLTSTLAIILLDDSGMRLSRVNLKSGTIEDITPPSYVTRKDLRAANGKLYFTSIASGKDEVHSYDLQTSVEHQISHSRFGSFSPSIAGDSSVVMTTYSIDGYELAKQKIEQDSLVVIEQTKMPKEILDPGFIDWSATMKLDTVSLARESIDTSSYKPQKYRRMGHLLNAHSWLPVNVDIEKIIEEHQFDMDFGAMIMSQNLLGTLVATVGYGYDFELNSNILEGEIEYTGLPVHFSVGALYGGTPRNVYSYRESPREYGGDYFSLNTVASLPITLSRAGRSRSLVPYTGLNYTNDVLINREGEVDATSVSKLTMGITYSNFDYTAAKELAPKHGYQLDVSSTLNPFNAKFGKIISAYGSVYVPGLFRLHSLNVRGNFQYQSVGSYNFSEKRLYPRGANYNVSPNFLYSSGLYYRLPIAYPDGGIPSLLYIKRIHLNLFGEYSHVRYYSGAQYLAQHPTSFGADLNIDFNVMRIGVDFDATLSLYRPSDNGWMFGLGFGFAI